MGVCMHMCVHVCADMFMYHRMRDRGSMCAHTYICTYIDILYIYIHIYIYILNSFHPGMFEASQVLMSFFGVTRESPRGRDQNLLHSRVRFHGGDGCQEAPRKNLERCWAHS